MRSDNEKLFGIIAGSVNIVVIALLFIDSFLLTPVQYNCYVKSVEKKKMTGRSATGGAGGYGYDLFYVNTMNDESYEIPFVLYNNLEKYSEVTILKTSLFNRPVKLISNHQSFNVGKLNNNNKIFWSEIIISIISLVSIICAFDKYNPYRIFHYLALLYSLFNLIFYFSS